MMRPRELYYQQDLFNVAGDYDLNFEYMQY